MSPRDVEYYRERAREERVRAKQTDRADVAVIHEELARLYEGLIGLNDPEPALRVVSSQQLPA